MESASLTQTLFIDVDTQLDFLFPGGALYIPGAEEVAPVLGELTTFAKRNEIPVISTIDAHAESDPEFRVWKPHCILGTQGQQKYSRTLLGPGIGEQIIVPKNTIDVFVGENLQQAIELFHAERYVVYGLATEYCVQSALVGLLKYKARVELVTDAIKGIDENESQEVVQRFEANGGFLTTARKVLGL